MSVYECHSNEQVIDLLSGGQGVFGVAIPGIMKELSGTISSFPAERVDPELNKSETVAGIDELAARRERKSNSA